MIGLRIVFAGLFALSVLADIYVAQDPKFAFGDMIGFYAWAGLAACVAFVILSWLLSALLARPDTYYDS